MKSSFFILLVLEPVKRGYLRERFNPKGLHFSKDQVQVKPCRQGQILNMFSCNHVGRFRFYKGLGEAMQVGLDFVKVQADPCKQVKVLYRFRCNHVGRFRFYKGIGVTMQVGLDFIQVQMKQCRQVQILYRFR